MGLKESGLRGSLRNVSVGIDAIPDASIFDNPIYRFNYNQVTANDGDTGFSLPETLGGLSDATAEGNPTFKADKSGTPAGDYDGTDDAHAITSDSQAPSGTDDFGFAALVWFKSTSDFDIIYSFGNDNRGESVSLGSDNGTPILFTLGPDHVTASGGSITTGQWATIGGWTENGGTDAYVTFDGEQVGSETGADSPNLSNSNHAIGYEKYSNSRYADVFIGDMIVMQASQAESYYSTYNTEWMDILS